ncbi:hypothetical protein FHR47_000322 [Xanthomonas arboricola]|nr:hypothetical protein [Xanthomonas cannabis]
MCGGRQGGKDTTDPWQRRILMGMIHILNRQCTHRLVRLRVEANASAGFGPRRPCRAVFTPGENAVWHRDRTHQVHPCRRLRRRGDRDSKPLHPSLPGRFHPGPRLAAPACRCPDLRSMLLAASAPAALACAASDRVYSMHAVPRWVKDRLHLPECNVAVVGTSASLASPRCARTATPARARSVHSSAPACTRSASSAHGNARTGHATRRGNQQKTPANAGVFCCDTARIYSAFAACTTCSAVILKYAYN